MKRYWGYLKYVIKHKWHVMLICFKYGIYWRGITHDLSKLSWTEFKAGARYFYNKKGIRIITEANFYNPCTENNISLERVRVKHYNKNDHHWQSWVLITDTGVTKAIEMPHKVVLEMLADWEGAGKAQENIPLRDWYDKYKYNIKLHPKTREFVERIINE